MDISQFNWNPLKNEWLKLVRGVSFEEIVSSTLITLRNHPRLKNQQVMFFEYKGYVWVIPFVVEERGRLFLKTAYASRYYTRKYRRGEL